MMKKLIIDTDIGHDIDDGLAIDWILKQSDIDLTAITIVTPPVKQRAMLAKLLVSDYGKGSIPVYCGESQALDRAFIQQECGLFVPQMCDPYQDKIEYQAVDALYHHLELNQKSTILTIAALTNLALLFEHYPDSLQYIDEIIMMGGYYHQDVMPSQVPFIDEWNILNDPVAAHKVFNSGAKIKAIGLDVTYKTVIHEQILHTEYFKQLHSSLQIGIQRWLGTMGKVIFHDPLAATIVTHPELMQYRKGRVDILSSSPHQSVFYPDERGNVEVATWVNVSDFFKLIDIDVMY
jgi:purine nucleosidase